TTLPGRLDQPGRLSQPESAPAAASPQGPSPTLSRGRAPVLAPPLPPVHALQPHHPDGATPPAGAVPGPAARAEVAGPPQGPAEAGPYPTPSPYEVPTPHPAGNAAPASDPTRAGDGIRLLLDDGSAVVVVGTALLGRNPTAAPDEHVDLFIPVHDLSRSVSK